MHLARGNNCRFHSRCSYASVRAVILLLLLLPYLLGMPSRAEDQQPMYEIDIPALNAAQALNQLAEQTGVYFLFPYRAAANQQANPVKGLYSLDDALQILLKDTGLRGGLSKTGVVTISLDDTDNEKVEGTSAMIQSKRGILASIASVFVGFGNGNLAAQETSDHQDDSSYRLVEEVVVTATRRETGIQETAMSVNAFHGELLEKNGYTSIGQILDTVPGVTSISSGPNANRIIIRNIATSTQESGSATSATYFDDFAVSGQRASAPEIRLVDVERVEVLKGPQGTLFGRSAMGGIVRYISNKPNPEAFAAGINAYVSDTTDGGNNVGGHGYVNIPIGDSFAARLVAYNYQNDGFIDNVELGADDFNDEDTKGGRLALRWQPSDELTLDFTYINQDVDGAPNWATTIHSPQGDIPVDVDRREQVAGIAMEQGNDHEIFNLAATYEFDSFTATLLATTSDEGTQVVFDQREFLGLTSGCVCDMLDSGDSDAMESDIFEFRLVSKSEGALDWIVGFYSEESDLDVQRLIRYFGDPVALFGGMLPLTDGTVLIDMAFENEESEKAVYGELGYSFSESTRLTVGYRRSDVEFENETLRANGIFDQITGTANLLGTRFETDEDVETYKISLEHSFNEDLFVYFTATSGYRRGGFNTPTFIAPFSTFDSDSLWNYEIGVKSTWLDGRLVANVSAYLLDWSDIQLVVQDPVTFNRATENVGEAEIPGFEFSLAYQLSNTLDIALSGSLSRPELQEDVPGGVSGKKGDSLPGSSEENFAFMANWQQPLSNGIELFATMTYKYVGSRLNDFNTDLDVKLDSYEIMDVRAGFRSSKGYSLSLFANNLFDEAIEYVVDRQGPFFESVPTNRPRTVGLNLTWEL